MRNWSMPLLPAGWQPGQLMAETVNLSSGSLAVSLASARGGGITAFTAAGKAVFAARPADTSPLGLACFPLLPFSNRIAFGRFSADGRNVVLPRNHPADPDHPHALHGLAWHLPWTLATATPTSCHLRLDVPAGAWPWAWRGDQWLTLDPHGLTHRIALTNLAAGRMPAGIGFHPWLPRNALTLFRSRHAGEWQTATDRLPVRLESRHEPVDWWHGQPVGTRIVDTVYTGRSGSMTVDWPDRRLALEITPSDSLSFTVVYVPAGADHFCVEPVSHMTDAINRDEPLAVTGLHWLAAGETLVGEVRYAVTVTP
jgi:aldose 1-epimerase